VFKRAFRAGTQVVTPFAGQFWGDRDGTVVKPSVTAVQSRRTSTISHPNKSIERPRRLSRARRKPGRGSDTA